MPDVACINGEFVDISSRCIQIEDRGYQFGDGVYEVVRLYARKLFAFSEHIQRFDRSRLELEIAETWKTDVIQSLVEEAVDRAACTDALVYIQLTRGTSPRAHVFPDRAPANLVITVREVGSFPVSDRETGCRAITLPDLRWKRRDIKSLNLLPNVLAAERAKRAGCLEAILVESDGTVTEGSKTNVFIVHEGVLKTAPNSHRILPGITRQQVLSVARKTGVPYVEEHFTRDELPHADEVFITGTHIEIVPIVKIDDVYVGKGMPGPITRRLYEVFQDLKKECHSHLHK